MQQPATNSAGYVSQEVGYIVVTRYTPVPYALHIVVQDLSYALLIPSAVSMSSIELRMLLCIYVCLFIYARLTKELYAVKSNLEVKHGTIERWKRAP